MATKVVLIGAGSYVFTPSTLYDLICDHRLPDLELWMVDPNTEIAELMAGIAHRMAERVDLSIKTYCTSTRREALPGAGFVTTSMAIDGVRRWHMDREVAEKHGVIDMLGELGGLGGLSYTLRQVPLMLGVAHDMEELCPDALLLNVSNPLPRIMTAITSVTKIRAYGFCNAAFGGVQGFENLSKILGMSLKAFEVVSAGTNHFNWLLKITASKTGDDLYPVIREKFKQGGPSLTRHCFETYGCLPLSGDSHIGEFFPFDETLVKRGDGAFHGTADERKQRHENLTKMAAGEMEWDSLLEHRSWERPADVIHSCATREPRYLPMLNVRNNGTMPELADEAVVEVPCRIEQGKVRPCPVGQLPEKLADLLRVTSEVNTLAGLAAANADRDMVHAVIDKDPAIVNKEGGHKAIDELIERHRDLLINWR
jgi:alpha-galactosidase